MTKTMTVIEIVAEYLESHGYDGLFNSEAECGCGLDDLAPCGEMGMGCAAGYRVPCDCGDHDYHIVSEKERDAVAEKEEESMDDIESRDLSGRLILAEAQRDEATRKFKLAEAVLSHLARWTYTYGKDLCPPGADTYGEGMRDAKTRIANILNDYLRNGGLNGDV